MIIIAVKFSNAQDKTEDYIHLSGVVIDGDSLKPMPFTHLVVKSSYTGTVADYYGYFSMLVRKGDTITFSNVGYQTNQFIVPEKLVNNEYSIIHLMFKETVLLEEVTIYPWPTFDEFKEAFSEVKTDKKLETAKSNLETDKLMDLAGKVAIEGSTIYKNQENYRHTMLYESNGYPAYGIFNPLAWKEFITNWKNGGLKDKRNKNYMPK